MIDRFWSKIQVDGPKLAKRDLKNVGICERVRKTFNKNGTKFDFLWLKKFVLNKPFYSPKQVKNVGIHRNEGNTI